MNDFELDNNHRYLIQFMLTNGSVTRTQALSFCTSMDPALETLTQLKTLIVEINREIANQFFKIILTTCEVTGEDIVLWINTKYDDLTRLQIGLTKIELEYFHALMKEIVREEEHTVNYARSINITSTLTQNFSREAGEKALFKWFKGGYFIKVGGQVYLGPKTILEFTSFLKANTRDCICELCSELVFFGNSCASCNKRFHVHCISKYLQNHHSCPHCRRDWQQGEMRVYNNANEDENEM